MDIRTKDILTPLDAQGVMFDPMKGIKNLHHLEALEFLDISETLTEDLSPLAFLTNLEELKVNRIKNFI